MIGNISILLIVCLAILVISMIRGWVRGFLGVLFSLVSVIVLIVLIARFTPGITAFVQDNTKIYDRLEERCVEQVDSWLETRGDGEKTILPAVIESILGIDGEEADGTADIGEDTSGTGSGEISGTGAGSPEGTGIADIAKEAGTAAREVLAKEIGTRLAGLLLKGAVFVIAVILAVIVVKIIEHLLQLVNKIPVLGGINRFFGILAGGLEGLILVWVILLVISLFAGTGSDGPGIQAIEDSVFLSFLYKNNLLWQLLQG